MRGGRSAGKKVCKDFFDKLRNEGIRKDALVPVQRTGIRIETRRSGPDSGKEEELSGHAVFAALARGAETERS